VFRVAVLATRNRQLPIANRGAIEQNQGFIPQPILFLKPLREYVFIPSIVRSESATAEKTCALAKSAL